MARRKRRQNSMGQRVANSTKQAAGRLLADWAALTWRADTVKIGPVSISTLNWLLLVLFGATFYFLPQHRGTVLLIAGVWLLITFGRAATIMPARRASLQSLYDSMVRTAGLPRGTAMAPANPADRIQVRSWGKKQVPTDLTLTIGDCPAATSVYARAAVEKALAAALGDPADDMVWVFDWTSSVKVRCFPAAADSEEASRQSYSNRVRATTARLFGIQARNSDDFSFTCSDWEAAATKAGDSIQVPTSIHIELGDFDYTDHATRDLAERGLDKRLKCPGEWLYQWGDGDLSLMQVERKSTDARRKRTIRKISDDVTGLFRSNRREDPPHVRVNEWFDHEKVAPDYPKMLEINFGTRNLSDRRVRDRFESDFDTAMAATYKEVTWLFDWRPSGASTTLTAKAVDRNSTAALRKKAERRLRNVVESKFGSSKNFVDCDILEWQKDLSKTGEALPQQALVNFGDYDVTNIDTQDAFEQHWDSLTDACDWHYAWTPAEGTVVMNAVPPLPDYELFPAPGTEAFSHLIDQAKAGKFDFGPRKGGGRLVWNLNKTPHALVGGKTGSGKSVALSLVLFYGIYLPMRIELIVCDPKRTDFTWTPEFPSVSTFAATDEEIVAAVQQAADEMDRRQSLLNKVGVRNLGQLRTKLANEPDLAKEVGPAPKRLILFFDEIADFLAKGANKDAEELKDEARANLEKIGRLGRALEVNIMAAAQKPDAKIISTQLRSQLGFRLGVGPLDQYESQQILNSDHGTRFPETGTPKGRSWGYDPADGYQMAQVMYLEDNSGPIEWLPGSSVIGAKDAARDHLEELGYAQTTITNRDGGTEPRWVQVEGVENVNPPSFDDEDDAAEAPEALDADYEVTSDSVKPAQPARGAEQPAAAREPQSQQPQRRPRLAVVPSVSDDDGGDPFA